MIEAELEAGGEDRPSLEKREVRCPTQFSYTENITEEPEGVVGRLVDHVGTDGRIAPGGSFNVVFLDRLEGPLAGHRHDEAVAPSVGVGWQLIRADEDLLQGRRLGETVRLSERAADTLRVLRATRRGLADEPGDHVDRLQASPPPTRHLAGKYVATSVGGLPDAPRVPSNGKGLPRPTALEVTPHRHDNFHRRAHAQVIITSHYTDLAYYALLPPDAQDHHRQHQRYAYHLGEKRPEDGERHQRRR